MRLSVSQPLANSTFERPVGPIRIVHAQLHPVVVPKVELREVAVQVLLAAVLVGALHAALEDGEVALDGVGVDDAAHVLALAVGRELVLDEGGGAMREIG